METWNVTDEFECQLKCIGNDTCKSFNIHLPVGDKVIQICELNNKTHQMKPSQFKKKIGSTYYVSLKISCVDLADTQSRQTQSGHCHPGYSGKHCTVKVAKGSHPGEPGLSCKDIKKTTNARKNGEYWIDPKGTGHPFKVYCDMTTEGGGWLLVLNVVTGSSPPSQLSVVTSYRGISDYHSNKMVITKSAMKEMYGDMKFDQLRFHCSKRQGRTFHVVTAANSSGNAVVQYFRGQTDVRPGSCGSFEKMADDNSFMAGNCTQWHSEKWSIDLNSFGQYGWSDEERLYNHAAWVYGLYHWTLLDRPFTGQNNRFECDDFLKEVSHGDFWKVFIR
ncbi:tenascin-N-like isoform X1 [Montipora foliosa]|uniref:tenascin-N-like isoform X1 n=1 Tax=Montipora foliosa TaxID=591990 RepID=UPI0035F1A2BF